MYLEIPNESYKNRQKEFIKKVLYLEADVAQYEIK